MGYVLKRTDQGGGFVTRPGSPGSYTKDILQARVFSTKEEADANKCPGNETVLAIDSLLQAG